MEKLKMHSPDLTQDNIARIRDLFPSCVTESKDAQGNIKLAVDFDQLRQELSGQIVEGPQERYHLNWPGKREALLTANAPIAKTLRPARDESVDFDTTKNLFIEGDNLEALKLLQETYLGKVKMIYIDPPYNTGNDFVYEDDFAEDIEEFKIKTNQKDEKGNRLQTNTEANGRFHSDWLSMMYSRIRLARNLLADDGVIFLSIDDNEVHNLRKVCDEIFGEANFIAELIWKRRASSALSDNNVSSDHEYVIAYQNGSLEGFIGIKKDFKNYTNQDNDPRGPWVSGDLTVGMNASMRPNQAYELIDPETGIKYPFNPNRVWAYIPESMNKLIEEKRVIFPKDSSKRPMLKRFQAELKSTHNPLSSIMIDQVGLNTEATKLMQEMMGGAIFEYSKPLSLIKSLIPQVTKDNDVILDFFAGSSSTAHAVFEQNSLDGCSRKFIMVQLPEECNKKSSAYMAGYQNIADISKERIRRSGNKVINGKSHENWNKDIGFRVLKIDSSNMADIYYVPDEVKQTDLLKSADNIKPDRVKDHESLLFQVLLDWGVDLTLPIRKDKIQGKDVYFVDENALVACFDDGISEDMVKELAGFKPLRVVFRDNGFESDAVKINVDQIFKQLSPGTEVKSI